MNNDERKNQIKTYLQYIQATIYSMEFSLRAQENEFVRYSSYREYIRKYNMLYPEAQKLVRHSVPADLYNLDNIPSQGDVYVQQAKSLFFSVHTNLCILKAYLERELDPKNDEVISLKDFFQSNLRRAVIHTPNSESDIQDVVEQLLIGHGLSKGINYDREVGRIKIANKEYVPDFVVYQLDMTLEVKFSKDISRSKAIVDEINTDISAYSQKYSRQLFIVYDMGSIRDEYEFKNGLDNSRNVSVIVVKH